MRSNLQSTRNSNNSQRNLSTKLEYQSKNYGLSPSYQDKMSQNKRASSDYCHIRRSANKNDNKLSAFDVKQVSKFENSYQIYSSPVEKEKLSLKEGKNKNSGSITKKFSKISEQKSSPIVNSFMSNISPSSKGENLSINRIPMSPIGFKTLSENSNFINTRCNTDSEKIKSPKNEFSSELKSPLGHKFERLKDKSSIHLNSTASEQLMTSSLMNDSISKNSLVNESVKLIHHGKENGCVDQSLVAKYENPNNLDKKQEVQHQIGNNNINHIPKIISKQNENKKDENQSTLSKLNFIFPKNLFQNLMIFATKKRFKCLCDPNLKEDETCSRAMKWMSKKYKPSEHEYLKEMYEKLLADESLADIEYVRQIKKDINRTFPDSKFFAEDAEGVKILERILNVFAKYDPKIGYVQGMNFIAGSLLYHAEEYQAFWLLVMIFEMFEMRDIYLPKLPGLTKHCQMIDMLIFNYNRKLYSHFCENNIKVEMFCSEWIFALFASVIPVENMALFYDNLLEYGWPFFYKIILAFLQQFEDTLLKKEDLADILSVLKSQNHITKFSMKNKNDLTLNWNDLFAKSEKMEIDTFFIYKMHSNFDVQNQWYKTSCLEK